MSLSEFHARLGGLIGEHGGREIVVVLNRAGQVGRALPLGFGFLRPGRLRGHHRNRDIFGRSAISRPRFPDVAVVSGVRVKLRWPSR
jgi:hypothetical protein